MSPTCWIAPTLRAIRWWPVLLGLAVPAVVVATQAVAVGPPSPWLGGLLLAALAGSLLVGLDDPAHELLDALPSGAPARLLHRLVPLGALVVSAALALQAIGLQSIGVRRSGSASAGVPGPVQLSGTGLVALVAVGLAVVVAGTRLHRPDLAITVAAPLPMTWVLVAAVASEGGGRADPVLLAWRDRPGVVVLVVLAGWAAVSLLHRYALAQGRLQAVSPWRLPGTGGSAAAEPGAPRS